MNEAEAIEQALSLLPEIIRCRGYLVVNFREAVELGHIIEGFTLLAQSGNGSLFISQPSKVIARTDLADWQAQMALQGCEPILPNGSFFYRVVTD